MKKSLFLLILLLLAACGKSGGDAPQTIDPASLQGQLAAFDSYRMTLYINIEGDGGEAQGVNVEIASVKEPPASHVVFSMQAPQEVAELNSIEFVEVGSDVYINLPQLGCMKQSQEMMAELGSPTQGLPTADQLLSTVSAATRVTPDETINGVLAHHYVFDKNDAKENANIETLDGHLYVAADSGNLLKLTMTGVGSASFLDPTILTMGAFDVDLNVLEINTPITIEPMANCESPAAAP